MSESGKKHKPKGVTCAKFTFCANGDCAKRAAEVRKALKEEIRRQGLEGKIRVKKGDCIGHCDRQPAVMLKKAGKEYTEVRLKEVPDLVEAAKKLLV